MRPVEEIARNARNASMVVATLPTDTKNAVLRDLAERIEHGVADVLAANERDLSAARDADIGDAKLRRLTLSDESIRQMADGLRQIAEMDDPVGKVARRYTAPSGLDVRKVRCPLGVIMMIYEARPNVTIDAFSLCFKAGNACILKGGREAGHSNEILANLAREALRAADVSQEAISLLVTSDRDVIKRLLEMDEYIDLVIPRGGAPLIRFVHKHSTIPTVQHFHGVCHIFVDASADVDKALEICTTAKTSAPATCNAVEAILVHRDVADAFVPLLVERFVGEGVEVRGDASVCALAAGARPAGDEDWGCEFLDMIVAIRVVDDVASAIEHIHQHGSGHTESILTNDDANAAMFTERVQSSCTMVNASTRFNDGFQLGLGAEIGISTSKIHAYGPMGLEELTAQRYVVRGAWLSR